MKYKNFSFPKRFAHLLPGELAQMQTKVVYIKNGNMAQTVYANLDIALAEHKLHEFAGPFGCSHNGDLCIRFESPEACEILSN